MTKRAAFFLVIIVLWLLCSYLFYLRFPNNYLYPNFYAEDGMVFAQSILTNGIFHSLFTTFNGYYVWGIYLIEYVCFLVNGFLYGPTIVNLPRIFAVGSYLFLGGVSVLPVILLRSYFKFVTLFLIVLADTFVPMPSTDFNVIGTIGNLKFAFAYIGLLLIFYRWTLTSESRKNYFVDAFLVICGFTNVTVYLFLPLMLICDGIQPKRLFTLKNWKVGNASLVSAVFLVIALSFQLIEVKIHGIPKFPHYLDDPLQVFSLPEIFIGRTLLYPLIFWCYAKMRLLILLGLLIPLIAASTIWVRGRHLQICVAAAGASLGIVGLFLMNRTGLSLLFQHFTSSGPDNFFYAANLCAVISIAVIIQEGFAGTKRYTYLLAVGILSILLVTKLPSTGSFSERNFMYEGVGNIYQNAAHACAIRDDSSHKAILAVYPLPIYHMTIDRALICSDSDPSKVLTSIKVNKI